MTHPVSIHSTPAAESSGTLKVAALALAALLSSLGTSVTNVALPTFASAFSASFHAVQWVILAYLLAMTVLVVSAGRLGDLMGRRRLMLAGIMLYTVASAVCATASELWMLIAARVVQGFGAAVMMALSMALVADVARRGRSGQAMGLLGSVSAVGTALGPALGGVLIEALGWQSIFLLNVPLGLAAFALVLRHLPPDIPIARRPSFDLKGSVLLAVTLVAYALAMTLERGKPGFVTASLLFAALVGAGLFMRLESRLQSPLLHPQLFRNIALGTGFAMGALVTTVVMTTLIVGPFYLTVVLALSPAAMGMVMTIGPLVAAIIGILAGHGVDRFGGVHITIVGLLAMTAGCIGLAVVPASAGIVGYVLPLASTTAGFGMFQVANNTTVMAAIEPSQRGVVSGLLNLSRNLGLITGASAMAALFAWVAGTLDIRTASSTAVVAGTHAAFGMAGLLTGATLVLAAVQRRALDRASDHELRAARECSSRRR